MDREWVREVGVDLACALGGENGQRVLGIGVLGRVARSGRERLEDPRPQPGGSPSEDPWKSPRPRYLPTSAGLRLPETRK